jgi:hypothetical protein
MKTLYEKNDPHRVAKFNQELDAVLQNQAVDMGELKSEDRRALDLAASLAGADLSVSQATYERLRWRLIFQARALQQPAEPRIPLGRFHMLASRVALILLVVFVGLVFTNLACLTASGERVSVTAYATDPLLFSNLPNGQGSGAQSMQIAPKIIPTPTASMTVVASRNFNGSSTSASIPGSTELSPTFIPVETP